MNHPAAAGVMAPSNTLDLSVVLVAICLPTTLLPPWLAARSDILRLPISDIELLSLLRISWAVCAGFNVREQQ